MLGRVRASSSCKPAKTAVRPPRVEARPRRVPMGPCCGDRGRIPLNPVIELRLQGPDRANGAAQKACGRERQEPWERGARGSCAMVALAASHQRQETRTIRCRCWHVKSLPLPLPAVMQLRSGRLMSSTALRMGRGSWRQWVAQTQSKSNHCQPVQAFSQFAGSGICSFCLHARGQSALCVPLGLPNCGSWLRPSNPKEAIEPCPSLAIWPEVLCAWSTLCSHICRQYARHLMQAPVHRSHQDWACHLGYCLVEASISSCYRPSNRVFPPIPSRILETPETPKSQIASS
jgi:hypothetical protein